MEQYRVLVLKEVIEKGNYFDGDAVCYGGEYGQQVCYISKNGNEEPITGLLYELYKNSNLNYYCYYVEGNKHGQYVCFYESGEIKSIADMYNGAIHGSFTEWYEDGNKKSKGNYKYGFCEMMMKWNHEGILVKEQLEPKEFDKLIIEKYERHERKLNGK